MVDQAKALRDIAANKSGCHNKLTHKSRIITITSGKGGVGKSNLTANLALAMANKGEKVVILDADFGMANVDIIFGLIPRLNLYDVVKGQKNLEEIILHGPKGIKIVPGGTGFLELANLMDFQRQRLLNQLLELEKEADIILIDTGAGISKTVIGFIAAAHDVLVITTPEPTSITDAYGISKVINKYDLQKEVKLVVNQVKNAQEGQEVAVRFSKVSDNYLQLKIDYLGYILHDNAVLRSVREQQPFIILYPDSKAAQCIENIADNLLSPGSNSNEISGMRGFFSKISKIFS
ncbi:MinD/ParA family protein [Candidatus Contubernalis alkaliaceticus]|uniref:MinD/ParA family protein n=1 Tax=Candidatus Contubernalis alkaliaceticus TaxID=338645 RepID=UPI001F4C044E|nr:MinD/ParA family protein [Candidatus Contubernalis alkalaceticus]UNC91763.1 MinD/ParA family protein [Candidatus Contubernalis alkalaceticus]